MSSGLSLGIKTILCLSRRLAFNKNVLSPQNALVLFMFCFVTQIQSDVSQELNLLVQSKNMTPKNKIYRMNNILYEKKNFPKKQTHYKKSHESMPRYESTNQFSKNKMNKIYAKRSDFLKQQQIHRKSDDLTSLGRYSSRDESFDEVSDYEQQIAMYHQRQYLHHLNEYNRRISKPVSEVRRLSPSETTSHNEHLLGCSCFPCLLARFDLVKTDRGYLATPDDTNGDLLKVSGEQRDPHFREWISKFDITSRGYGFEMVLKHPKTSSQHHQHPKISSQDQHHRIKELKPEDIFSFGRLEDPSQHQHHERSPLQHPKTSSQQRHSIFSLGRVQDQRPNGDELEDALSHLTGSQEHAESQDDFYDYFDALEDHGG